MRCDCRAWGREGRKGRGGRGGREDSEEGLFRGAARLTGV
jgi:hypothetical protein